MTQCRPTDRTVARFQREMAETKNRIDAYYEYKRVKAEGITLGKAEEKLEIARKMKGMGLPISQIAEGTGLSPEVIAHL